MATTEHSTAVQAPNAFKDFWGGVSSYARAWQLIKAHRLWYYVYLPGFISIFLGLAIGYVAFTSADEMVGLLTGLYPESWWGFHLVEKIASVFSWVILALSGLVSYRILLMAIVSPFMTPLAAQIQSIQLGKLVYDPPFFSFTNFRLILRGAVLALRNVAKELWFTLLLLLLGLIPPFSAVTPFLILAVQSFYAGFGNMDYALEKYYGVGESKKFAARYRYLAIGNGLVFITLLGIPILGLFLAPALSTVAATLETTKRIDAPLKNVQQLQEFI